MINELDSEDLSNHIEEIVDAPIATLEIWCDNGKHIIVPDNHAPATLGLRSIQNMFEELRDIEVWKPWDITSLNDSTYLSFSQSFRSAHNINMSWYSEEVYKDTVNKKVKEPKEIQVYFYFNNAGVDLFDTINIKGNHTYRIDGMAFIQLNNDQSFVFGQTSYPSYDEATMISAGLWKMQNDTLELNWDLDHTVSAMKDSTLCLRYFHRLANPIPLTIEKWRLTYWADLKKLRGIRVKNDWDEN